MKHVCTTSFWVLLFSLGELVPARAQLATFQRLFYKNGGDLQLFSGEASPDGGYVLGGIVEDGAVSRPIIVKLDCAGDIAWVKTLGPTTTVQNVFTRVGIVTMPDTGAVLLCNVGTFNAYSMVVLRVDKNGNTLWRRAINQGLGDTGGHGIAGTTDGGFVITGYTNRYGSETPGGSYRDVYLLKLDGAGNITWTKTYGNKSAYDEGTSVIQTSDGGYAVCGRFIDQGTFYAFLLKTDPVGTPEFMRTYGDTLHSTWAFGLQQMADGGYALTGSTTVLQQNFQSWGDNFVLRTNMVGDTLWARGFFGLPNLFENASSLVLDAQENLVVGVATASYPTIGFVPNKHLVARFAGNGALQTAKLFNTGGSHYPLVSKTPDGGYLVTGFTNNYLGLDFTGLAIKTDANLEAGCHTTDATFQTITQPLPIRVRTPAFTSASGGVASNYTIEQSTTLLDSVLCQAAAPALVCDFSVQPGCFGTPIQFTNESSAGVTGFSWDFDDPASGSANTSVLPNPTHVFSAEGSYDVRLEVTNGCQTASVTLPVAAAGPPTVSLGPDTVFCSGETLLLDVGIAGATYEWNTGATSQTLTVSDSGLYIVKVFDGLCTGTDSVFVRENACDLLNIPNAFTPDGDGNNDAWKPIIGSDYTVRLVRIYSRWGEEVFTSTDTSFAWNGTHNGENAPSDVYVFYLELNSKDQTVVARKGDITLLR
ncbi:MAG: T9SS type B sorting domain-containing protein [Saprospiraceae bacterium]